MEVLIAIFLFIGIVGFILMLISDYREGQKLKHSNRSIIENKAKQLQTELNSYNIAKLYTVPVLFNKTICVGISMATQNIVIYSPINSCDDDLYIKAIPFSTVIGCEIIEDNETIQAGGLGRAVVGGILAGGVGAIVGASTRPTVGVVNSLKLKIVLNDILNPCYEIVFIDTETQRLSSAYKEMYQLVHELYSAILVIKNNNQKGAAPTQPNNNIVIDTTEEIRKFKQLLDDGIITQEEFDAKKKQLLGL